jgi:hypothetical protein
MLPDVKTLREGTVEFPIPHEAFAGRGLAVRLPGLLRGPRVVVDGTEVAGKRLRFTLRDNFGNLRELRLKASAFDPVPKVVIEGSTIQLARPLAWYEYAWMAIPIGLVAIGGGLGALFGILAIFASARVFRSERSTPAKYAISACFTVAAAVAFLVAAFVLQEMLRPGGS